MTGDRLPKSPNCQDADSNHSNDVGALTFTEIRLTSAGRLKNVSPLTGKGKEEATKTAMSKKQIAD